MDKEVLMKRGLQLLGIIILIVFLSTFDKNNLNLIFNIKNLNIILIALTITFLNVLSKAYRWKLLIKKTADKTISLRFAFISIIAGVATGSLTPGRVEMAKPMMLKSKWHIPLSISFSATFIERISDFFILLIIILTSLFYIPINHILNKNLILAALIFTFTVILALAFYPLYCSKITKWLIRTFPFPKRYKEKLQNFCQQFFSAFSIFREKVTVSKLTLLSAIGNSLEILQFYLILKFLGVEVSIIVVALVYTSTLVLGVLSMIPGGIGIIEITTSGFLSLLLQGSEGAIQTSILLNRLIGYYLLVLIGAIALMSFSKHSKELDSQQFLDGD